MGLFPLVQYAQLLFKSNQWRPCAEWIRFIRNTKNKTKIIWHRFRVDRAGRGGWVLLRGATRAWARATHRLMTKLYYSVSLRWSDTLWVEAARSTSAASLRRLLRVDVHVLWVPQQANPLLLLSLLRHLQKVRKRCNIHANLLRAAHAVLPPRQTLRLDGLWNSAKPKMRAAVWSALASDERSRIQDTKTETQLQEISEIKQSAWVITQVLASITEGIKMNFRLSINFKQHKGVICASTLKRNNINSEKTKFCNECSQRNSSHGENRAKISFRLWKWTISQ